jgi:low temperature requirement protein LtrA
MESTADEGPTTETGKRVSWVELYLDLVFVLAIGELASLIISPPKLHTVWVTLGLFVVLWWMWVGLTILYNRHGFDERATRRLSRCQRARGGCPQSPLGPPSRGHIAAFAVSLVATRVVLAVGNTRDDRGSPVGDDLRWRTVRAFALSAVLFIVSIGLPRPLPYLLWSAAYLHESSVMFAGGQWCAGGPASDRSRPRRGPLRPAQHSRPPFRMWSRVSRRCAPGASGADVKHPDAAAPRCHQ